MLSNKKQFTAEQKQQIVDAIAKAERNTSAEIRVHIENHCKEMVLDRAVRVFHSLKMDQTKDRNGVLIYVAMKDRVSAIIGDIHVNMYVDNNFWNDCYAEMAEYFKKEAFTQGICTAIHLLEIELKSHFPHQKDDVDELPNEITFGD